MNNALLLTLEEAGARLSVSARTVRRLIDAGDLAPVRIGRAVRLSTADLSAYIARQMSGSNIASGVAVPETDTCHAKPKPDQKRGSTNGRVRRIGGSSTPTDTGARLAAVLGFPSPKIPRD